MRGDQLARQWWRVIRAIEAGLNGLTVTENAQRGETGIRTIYRELKALPAAGFPPYTRRAERGNRRVFIDTLKFKIPPPFTLNELMSIFSALPHKAACQERRRKNLGQRRCGWESRASGSYPGLESIWPFRRLFLTPKVMVESKKTLSFGTCLFKNQ